MATRRKLTDIGIQKMTLPATGRLEVWDTAAGLGGFGLRLTPNGIKAFQVLLRFRGRQKRLSLGHFIPATDKAAALPMDQRPGALTLSEAREQARTVRAQAKAGLDPDAIERAAAAARAKMEADTFAAVREKFIEAHCRLLKTGADVAAYLRRDLKGWDALPIRSIGKQQIIEAIERKAQQSGGYASNRLRAHLFSFLRWCEARDYIAAVPRIGIEKAEETPRERVLSESEIKQLWDAWSRLGDPYGPMFMLLLVSGQRRTEVAGMRWADIKPRPVDAEATDTFVPIEWTWTISADRTKAGRSHEVPMADLALSIIAAVPRGSSAFVFPVSRRGGRDDYARDYSAARERCDALCDVRDWRLHDLRRTCGTGMASLGIAVSTISRVLGHAEGGITKIYNRYSYGNEKRLALNAWARKVASIVGITPAPEPAVVDLAERRKSR
jgi:integrase